MLRGAMLVLLRRVGIAVAVLIALTCYLTWPQCIYLASRVAEHDDGLFSTWRLAWIAHALRTDPGRLFDANIFYPDTSTLASSDATLLQGALAAPFLWSGAPPIAVYNLSLLAGIVLSGLGMLVLARHLIQSDLAALVAAAIFTTIPYRVEHFEHLELQWLMFVPLTFWAVHRAVAGASIGYGLLAGVFVWLQLLASVYYGIFLAVLTALLTVLLFAVSKERSVRAAAGLAAGGLVAGALALIVAQPYLANAKHVGMRDVSDIAAYSAVWRSYLTAPVENWWWGWTSPTFVGDELHLFPGLLATILAVIGLVMAPRRLALIYGVLLAVTLELSLGMNGWLYPALHRNVLALQGLRATARISMLGFCALALLAGFGVQALQSRVSGRWRSGIAIASLLAVALEYGSAPMQLMPARPEVPSIYRMLRMLPRGPVAELPMPTPRQGSAYDTLYMFSSLAHWYPLVNGYSGFIPEHYNETMDVVKDVPSDWSIDHLRRIGTRYLIVHDHGYLPEKYMSIISGLRSRADIVSFGRYRDADGGFAELFEIVTSRPPVGN
jgi:hypothetical protein